MRPLLLAALLAVLLAGLLPLGLPGAAGARERWTAPVPGPVTRAFDFDGRPFATGEHRGVDLAASPGELVRATCTGRVAVARRVGSAGRLVTLRCGPWRVTHLPLAAIGVRQGALVGRGEPIGTAGRAEGHEGLHLGVRREGESSGYVDPLHLLGRMPQRPPPAGPGRRASRRPRGPGSSPARARLATRPIATRSVATRALAAGSLAARPVAARSLATRPVAAGSLARDPLAAP